MRQIKEFYCSPRVTSLKSVKFEIIDSKIELKCTICNGIVGCWDEPVHIERMPFKRKWSEEECRDMR
jgi:hypothetical protein